MKHPSRQKSRIASIFRNDKYLKYRLRHTTLNTRHSQIDRLCYSKYACWFSLFIIAISDDDDDDDVASVLLFFNENEIKNTNIDRVENFS